MTLKAILFAATILLIGSSCVAQAVRVRLINEEAKKPISDKRVKIYLYQDRPDEYRAWDNPTLVLRTDSQGEAQFRLSTPRPGYVYMKVDLARSQWECKCVVMSTSSMLMESNGVHHNDGSEEIIILIQARPHSLWQRLFSPFLQ
jgi:hypothetical protein